MFHYSGFELLLFCAALQIVGALLGVFQGTMKARIAHIGSDRGPTIFKRHSAAIADVRIRIAGGITGALSALTLVGFAGMPTAVLSLLFIANSVLPILGCVLFVLPAWAFSSGFVARSMQPVDATA
ncbi:MAG: hypothetical protein ABJ263_02060 [Tateyamaria sp.]|uniref:hypothetical protein n=1 Tax=Tateyamaria sp. TaxID=1929288 RepID=UPI003278321F